MWARGCFFSVLLGVLWHGLVLAANVTFEWPAATDNVAVTGYRLYYRTSGQGYTNSVDVGNVLTGTVTGLLPNTLYYFTIVAYDASQNLSPFAQETGEITGPTTPTAPTNLRDAGHHCRLVRLRWQPGEDDLAITQYRVYRDFVPIGTTNGTTLFYDDGTAVPSTTATYHVRSADAGGNESGNSNAVVMTTPACP